MSATKRLRFDRNDQYFKAWVSKGCFLLGILSSCLMLWSCLMLSSCLRLRQINVSSAVLKAAAHHYGSQCDRPNKEFMLCRWEEKDPRKCLEEGRKVNECALNFFR